MNAASNISSVPNRTALYDPTLIYTPLCPGMSERPSSATEDNDPTHRFIDGAGPPEPTSPASASETSGAGGQISAMKFPAHSHAALEYR